MRHWYKKPNKLVKDLVRTTLIIEGFSKAGTNEQPVFTNGMPTLLCRTEKNKSNLQDVTDLVLYTGTVPSGNWSVNERTTIIACFFYPLVMPGLFNISARKLSESPVDLSHWRPQVYNALRTQLIYAATTARKTEVIDNLVIQQISENQKVCEIVRYSTDQILCYPDKGVLPKILEKLNINERTFQRIFKKYVGITPTQYRRICQFQRSFGQLRSKRFDKLSDVAFDTGFSDQSHFIRSFREFTQISPYEYLKNGLTAKIP